MTKGQLKLLQEEYMQQKLQMSCDIDPLAEPGDGNMDLADCKDNGSSDTDTCSECNEDSDSESQTTPKKGRKNKKATKERAKKHKKTRKNAKKDKKKKHKKATSPVSSTSSPHKDLEQEEPLEACYCTKLGLSMGLGSLLKCVAWILPQPL